MLADRADAAARKRRATLPPPMVVEMDKSLKSIRISLLDILSAMNAEFECRYGRALQEAEDALSEARATASQERAAHAALLDVLTEARADQVEAASENAVLAAKLASVEAQNVQLTNALNAQSGMYEMLRCYMNAPTSASQDPEHTA